MKIVNIPRREALTATAPDVTVVVVVPAFVVVGAVVVVGSGVTGVIPGHIGAVPLQAGLDGSNFVPRLNSSLIFWNQNLCFKIYLCFTTI